MDLKKNNIQNIPASIGFLKKLATLNIMANPIKTLPSALKDIKL